MNPLSCKWCQKKARVGILISDKIVFKTKTVEDKDGYYTVIKETIQQVDVTILNIYSPNIGSPKYIKQLITSTKELVNNNTIMVEDFNTPLTSMDRSYKQNMNKETVVLNGTLEQMDLTDIFRTFHLKTPEYTFFSSAQDIFQNKLHSSPQNKAQQIQEDQHHAMHLS